MNLKLLHITFRCTMVANSLNGLSLSHALRLCNVYSLSSSLSVLQLVQGIQKLWYLLSACILFWERRMLMNIQLFSSTRSDEILDGV